MYCAFVKDCEKVAAYLKDQGISATVYNGQMEEGEKSEAFPQVVDDGRGAGGGGNECVRDGC